MKGYPVGRLKRWYGRQPIARKMQLATVTTIVVLLVAFILVIFLYFYSVLLNQAVASAHKDLLYAQNKLDALVERVETYSLTLLSDETVQEYLNKASSQPAEEPVDNLASLNMQKRINTIVGSDKAISAVLVYDMQGRVYDSGITMNTIDQGVYGYPSGAALWVSTHEAPYRGVFDWTINRQVVSFIRSIGDYHTGNQIGYLEICVVERTIADLYRDSAAGDAEIFMVSGGGEIVSHPDQARLYRPFAGFSPAAAGEFVREGDSFLIARGYPRLGWYILAVVPQKVVLGPIWGVINMIWIIGFAVMLISVLLIRVLARGMTRSITKLADAMTDVQRRGWQELHLDITAEDEIGTLSVTFREMVGTIRDTTRRLLREQNAKREYQLELLQQQINPHFLYNTLDNVCALAQLGQNDKLVTMVGDITRFYRGVLNRGGLIISLEKEMEIARSYLNIMMIRFYGSFTYTLRYPDHIARNVCLRLTLQPLLENAIHHGFVAHVPGGVIGVAVRVLADCIVLCVSDNGVGMGREAMRILSRPTPEGEKRSFGLITVHQRVRLYFGGDYGVKVYSQRGKGCRILIKLPRQPWNAREHTPVREDT